jgi:hypothetical protein
MVSHATFRGGASYITLGVDGTVPYGGPRLWKVTASTTGIDIALPDLDDPELPTGKKLLGFLNDGANAFDVNDSNGLSQTRTVAAGDYVWCSTFVDSEGGSPTLGRSWMFRSGTMLT